MPAHRPDVGIVHAQQADRRGNVQLWGILGVQKEAVLASARSIVTVEEIVDELEPRPGAIVLPRWVVDAVARRAGRRASVVRARLLRARQRLLRRVGRDQPRPRPLPRVDAAARPRHGDVASTTRLPGSRSRRDAATTRRRDDGRRGGAAARRTTPSASSASACRASPRTSRGARTRPAACSSTRAARSARSRRTLPLSIGDGELAETADAVVSVPEMFAYWLQGGRIDVGFLGAAQIDRHGNLNSTVIGDYDAPKVRLPGRRRRARDRHVGRECLRDAAPLAARVRRASSTSRRASATTCASSSPISASSSRATAS